MKIAFFEDEYFENFLPLTYTRPTYDLRCGTSKLYEKIVGLFPSVEYVFFTRDYLAPIYAEQGVPTNKLESLDDDILLINGSLLASSNLKGTIESSLGKNTLAFQKERLAFAYLKSDLVKEVGELFLEPIDKKSIKKLKSKAESKEVSDLKLLEYTWELVNNNAEKIKEEFSSIAKGDSQGEVDSKATIYGDPKNLYVAKGAFVEAGVVIDVRNGPVYIGENTYVQTLSRIDGPSYIGKDNIIFGAQIREGCSFGAVCRIGGEVEETIVQGYSNKRHLGFIGHSYLGEWVNLGAGTTNSDLKNTYGTVKVTVRGEKVGAGQFVGTVIGDHSKTSIGAMILTGKKVGVSSQVIAYATEDVPSFTMWAKSLGAKPTEIFLDSAVETARRMMARRKVNMTKDYENMLRKVYDLTKQERKEAKVKKGKFKLE
jgi:UDP-N-acetylglucosamine diphosphorylase/glucosamine-1-phosphate N-acetyltransferase